MKRQKNDMNGQHPGSLPVQVAILLTERLWAGSVVLARELLQAAGTLAARSSDVAGSALFDVRLLGVSRRAVASFGGQWMRPDARLSDGDRFDVVIVPAQFAPQGTLTEDDRKFSAWLQCQYAAGAVVLSLGGASLLAKAGLLDGREATGLISEQPLFRRYFPRVRYEPSRHVVVSGKLITVCGIGPTAEACAHLIERFIGVGLAARFRRHTSTESMPMDQQLSLWSARFRTHGDAQVLAAQDMLERDLSEPPPLSVIAQHVGLGERTLSRRFGAATGRNLRQYASELRLEQADFLLRTTRLPVAHVAVECGFSGASALSRAFALRRGCSPSKSRKLGDAG